MPRNTSTSCRRTKLVDDVSRDEVDIVVSKAKSCVADAISSQLVQFGFFNPLTALGHRGFVEVKLEPQGDLVEVVGMETNDILDFRIRSTGGERSGRREREERERKRERERGRER